MKYQNNKLCRFEKLESRDMLSSNPLLPGDFNNDRVVDAADYVTLRKDITTTQDDYNIWRGAFGNVLPPPNWFDSNIQDEALRNLGSNLYVDGLIDRHDIVTLLKNVEDDNVVNAIEFNDLKSIANNAQLFNSKEDLIKLTNYLVLGNTANNKYQGQPLGNLVAGSSDVQLDKLINKWFLGLDRPYTPYAYAPAIGSLFINGPAYSDIDQGYMNDCGFLASLAETALHNPNFITNMFIVNDDNTYTVRFYQHEIPEYITIDSYLPGGGGIYAGIPNNELWVAFAEKAYAQIGELNGFNRANIYTDIEFMFAFETLRAINGSPTAGFNGVNNLLSNFESAYNAGKLICMITWTNPTNAGIVGNHVYAVIDYNAETHTVTLFNPWGINYGLITLTWDLVQNNISYYDYVK